MKDYHIYAHFQRGQNVSPTSPRYQASQPQTVSVQPEERQAHTSRGNFLSITPLRMATTALAVAHKITSYVGELTENRVAARRTQVGLTFAGLGVMALSNPATAAIAAALYVGNATATYGIRVYKENLSADYMRQLSGGTVKTGR
jgi:hypothetical protein